MNVLVLAAVGAVAYLGGFIVVWIFGLSAGSIALGCSLHLCGLGLIALAAGFGLGMMAGETAAEERRPRVRPAPRREPDRTIILTLEPDEVVRR